MKSTSRSTLKTVTVIAVLLATAGALAGSLATSTERAAFDGHDFVGTRPALGATEGNATDLSH